MLQGSQMQRQRLVQVRPPLALRSLQSSGTHVCGALPGDTDSVTYAAETHYARQAQLCSHNAASAATAIRERYTCRCSAEVSATGCRCHQLCLAPASLARNSECMNKTIMEAVNVVLELPCIGRCHNRCFLALMAACRSC